MIHLIYVSAATSKMLDQDLTLLLEQARERNKKLNITGLLLFFNGNFMQMLEGEQNDVEAVYNSIIADTRNCDNRIIQQKPITERAFPDWQMGFKNLDNKLTLHSGYSSFLNNKTTAQTLNCQKPELLALFNNFKKNNR